MEKDTLLLIRISKKEKAHAAAQAEAVGLSLSAYARALLSGTATKAKTDKAALAELARQGGLVKHLFNQGAEPSATWAALKALEAAAAKLAG